jgi:hypothetical protein
MLTAFALPLTGCGGINAGGTVSPAMFFLKNNPPPTTGARMIAAKPSKPLAQQFAQAR